MAEVPSRDLPFKFKRRSLLSDFPIPSRGRTLSAEVRVSLPEGFLLATSSQPFVLEAEVYQNGVWVEQAEDTFR